MAAKTFKKLLCFLASLPGWQVTFSQPVKPKISLKDSLNKAIDFSDWIIQANGFVPVPFIITEPALGGFGGASKWKIEITLVAPDITGAIGVYTLNDTWMLGGFRSGALVKQRIKYTVGAAYVECDVVWRNR